MGIFREGMGIFLDGLVRLWSEREGKGVGGGLFGLGVG